MRRGSPARPVQAASSSRPATASQGSLRARPARPGPRRPTAPRPRAGPCGTSRPGVARSGGWRPWSPRPPRRGSSRPRGTPSPRGSRSRCGRCGPPRDRPRAAGVPRRRSPASNIARTRCSIRGSSVGRSMSTPIWTLRGSAYTCSGSDALNGRPVIATTSSARTIRRPLSGRIRAAAVRVRLGQTAVQSSGTDRRQLGLEPRAVRRGRCQGTRTGPARPGCRGPTHRRAPACGRARGPPRSPPAPRPWNSATVSGSVTSSRSSR